jgi:hypothetical protein
MDPAELWKCGSHHLFAARGRELKRLAPLDVGEILPVIHLGLIDEDCAARLDKLSWPAGILRPKRRNKLKG